MSDLRLARQFALPTWDPALSDGCSVPSWLRWLVPLETPAQVAICRAHDQAYYYGGSVLNRRRADVRLRVGLLANGFSRWRACLYYIAVRLFGAPSWWFNRRRWAFGGKFLRYD